MNDYMFVLCCECCLLMLFGWVCIVLLVGVLYLQYVKNEDLCLLCIIQCYFFCVIGIFVFLVVGICNWCGVWVFELLIVIVVVGGVGMVVWYLLIQMNLGFSCGFDMLQLIVDSLLFVQWFFGMFKVVGLCEIVYLLIFGILLFGWVLIGFVVILVVVVVSFWCYCCKFVG